MMKNLMLTALLATLAAFVTAAPAHAQDAANTPAAAAAAGLTAAPRASGVFITGGPINLTPGGYILRQNAQQQAQRASGGSAYTNRYVQPNPNSAQVYNQSLVQTRARTQRSLVPSPFPPGFGE